ESLHEYPGAAADGPCEGRSSVSQRHLPRGAAELGRSAAQEGHMAGKIILETERLFLREFDEGDVAPFYLMGSDPAVIRYTGDPAGGLTSIEHALEVLRSRPLADYRKYGYGRWACVLKAGGEV